MSLKIARHQLSEFNATSEDIEDLVVGHEELLEHYFLPGHRLGIASGDYAEGRVLGVGIAEGLINGQPTGKPALLMLLDRLPEGGGLPFFSGRGVPIIHQAVGEIHAASYQSKNRPVQGGVSIAPSTVGYSGTLGCLVTSGQIKYILSNNHVLSNCGTVPPNTAILQQSIQDGGTSPADRVAALSFAVPIQFGLNPNPKNIADAAIARCDDNINFDPRILRDDNKVEKLVMPVTAPKLTMAVQKSGRTTGYTRGGIKVIGLTHTVNYGVPGNATFENVFSVQKAAGNFCQGGDSGSLITTQAGNQPVGLLFAVDTASPSNTYANPLSDALSELAKLTGQEVKVVY